MIKCVKSQQNNSKSSKRIYNKKNVSATTTADNMINDLFKEVLDKISEKENLEDLLSTGESK